MPSIDEGVGVTAMNEALSRPSLRWWSFGEIIPEMFDNRWVSRGSNVRGL